MGDFAQGWGACISNALRYGHKKVWEDLFCVYSETIVGKNFI